MCNQNLEWEQAIGKKILFRLKKSFYSLKIVETQMLAQKWLTLFACEALIKMLCCLSMQWTETWHTRTRLNLLCLALIISIKIYLPSLIYHHHSQEHFFNCNITGSPFLKTLLKNMLKLLFLFFLSDCNVRYCFL